MILNLNEDEYRYLEILVKKLMAIRSSQVNNPAENWGKSLDILYSQLVDDGSRALRIRRPECKHLSIYIRGMIKILEKSTLPGYVKRSITPKLKEKYAPYIEKCKKTKTMLEELLIKVEKGL